MRLFDKKNHNIFDYNDNDNVDDDNNDYGDDNDKMPLYFVWFRGHRMVIQNYHSKPKRRVTYINM